MNTNLSISGSHTGAQERSILRSSESTVNNDQTAIANSNSLQRVPSMINNVAALKNAELKGDSFTISQEQVVKAIESAMKSMQGKATSLEFTVHEPTKRIAVKVLDSDTGDIIREIPPEKSLDFIAKLWEMAGIIIDEKR
ncbi:hypothetical protein BK133_10290 [Paenibacillus sp. FSL H8-0548]|uniref:flagellar protein FlaG n=1 Tax=Paenibacillus sp. FSL H8-0548 TaxID=1920422 RepID=UPI00097013CA|nr:flagellar protein FlaG [Paenibacillus sp. FSL H8-0548]OMF35830.1 hypothetical protein BK133_10290 [Paenibacillus sp. FSL H8-0548]